MTKKRIFWWLKTLFVVYVVGGFALYYLQDYILFHPVTLKRNENFDFKVGHRDISIPVNDEDTINIVDFSSTTDSSRGVVLYFHGNKKNINWYAPYIPYFTRHGYQVLMIDYPGYGKSTGKLTEEKLYKWAAQVYKIAHNRFPAEKIIIYGKSMGTGIATQLAATKDCKRLILETPYYDFPSVVKHYLPVYPVNMMLHYEFPTHQFLPDVKAPVTIFHGTSDWVVSYKNSLRLQQFLKAGDELVTIPGGDHNNLYQYKKTNEKLDSVLVL